MTQLSRDGNHFHDGMNSLRRVSIKAQTNTISNSNNIYIRNHNIHKPHAEMIVAEDGPIVGNNTLGIKSQEE